MKSNSTLKKVALLITAILIGVTIYLNWNYLNAMYNYVFTADKFEQNGPVYASEFMLKKLEGSNGIAAFSMIRPMTEFEVIRKFEDDKERRIRLLAIIKKTDSKPHLVYAGAFYDLTYLRKSSATSLGKFNSTEILPFLDGYNRITPAVFYKITPAGNAYIIKPIELKLPEGYTFANRFVYLHQSQAGSKPSI